MDTGAKLGFTIVNFLGWAIVLVPICPHTLSNRPMVIDGDSEMEILVCGHTDSEHVRVTCDGQTCIPLAGRRIRIRQHKNKVRLIHPDQLSVFIGELHQRFRALRKEIAVNEGSLRILQAVP